MPLSELNTYYDIIVKVKEKEQEAQAHEHKSWSDFFNKLFKNYFT